MNNPKIGGVLQIGIGVIDMPEARNWYCKTLNFSAQVLEEKAVTALMKAYTGGKPQKRQASIIMNMSGGGGLEIWQYLNRQPKLPGTKPQLGDLGIFAIKLKCQNLHETRNKLIDRKPTEICESISGENSFFFCDPYGNWIEVVASEAFFEKPKTTSGCYGVVIGCSDLDESIEFYCKILGFELIRKSDSKKTVRFEKLPGGQNNFKSAFLLKQETSIGGFSKFLGSTEIELVQSTGYKGVPIYKDRYWGDPGFMHVCFDVKEMDHLKKYCEKFRSPFLVDSIETEDGQSFNMGDVTSRVAYINDPDGTAIEFVETHKLPLLPALGIAINLKGTRRDVPNWVYKIIKLRGKKRYKLK